MPRKTKRACPKGCRKAKKRRKPRKRSKWMTHVMAEYRKNKSGGLSSALRRAKKSYRTK